jgi:hypothetical protein
MEPLLHSDRKVYDYPCTDAGILDVDAPAQPANKITGGP